MRFGNTLTSLRGMLVTMGILGIILAVLVTILSATGHARRAEWWQVVILALIPLAGSTLACAPTLMFCIRVEDGRVKHVMFDRHVLSDYPLSEFERMQRSRGPWAAKLVFSGGRSIRFFGAHLGTIAALKKSLEESKRSA